MTTSVIGALRIVLGADTAALDRGLEDSRAKLGQFAGDIAATGAIIGAAIATAYSAVALGVSNTLKSMDEINKSSQKMGVPVEHLSALRLAADLSDVSMEALSKGVGKLSKSMVEAAGDPMSSAANAFRALGVSVRDSNGQLRPTIDVTQDIATKFEGMKDGAGKTAASMAVFGKAGADLIPLLNAGGAGLQQMMDRAKALGVTFDKDTAAAAEKFRDTLTMLGAAKDGLIVKLTAYLLPALQAFADRMLASASNVDKQNQKLSVLKSAFDLLARGVLLVSDNFKLLIQIGTVFVAAQIAAAAINMGIAFLALGRAIYQTGLVLSAFEAIRKISMVGWLLMAGVLAVATGNFDAMVAKVREVGSEIMKALPEGAGVAAKALGGLGINLDALTADLSKYKGETEKATKSQTDFNFSALAGKNAIDKYIDSQKKHLEGQAAEIQTFGMLPGAMEAAKIQLQALSIATANHTTISAAQQLQLDATKQKALEYGQTLAGLQMVQANLTPSQTYQLELFKIQSLFDNGKLSAEQYGIAMQRAAENAGATWENAGAQMAGGFADLANAFSKSNKEMAVAGKAFGIIQATINTYTAFTKALASAPPPLNYALAAGVLAAGMAKVAAISSQSTGGMMTGGSFTVPGSGGPDSQRVALDLSPGEQVDVWRPEQGGGADPRRGAGKGTTVNLAMPIAATRDAFRAIIEGLNDAISDGYRLNVVPA